MKNKISFLIILFLLTGKLYASAVTVFSVEDLQKAINKSSAGDIIILANGIYSNANIEIKVNGIEVKAANDGGVIFDGASRCKIFGDKNTFRGFQFKNVDVKETEVVEVSGNYNLITQCNFYNCNSKHYLHFDSGSHDNEVSYCNIEAKPAIKNGNSAIQINTSPQVISHTKIRYCTFLNFMGQGGDFGNEPIRIGLGVEQNNVSGCIVEYCYFENVGLGDSESISLKSTYNVVRYNTCYNNPHGQFVFRTGNHSSAYGNFFINSGGIRIKEGHNHMIYNNYFEGEGKENSLQLMNFKLNQKTLVGSALDTIYVYHNTFYNTTAIDLGGDGDNPPMNVKFINNIFYKKSGAIFSNVNPNNTYINNILFGNAGLKSNATKKEFISVNPLLEKGSFNYYVLTATSPAINKATVNYPSILKNPVVENDAKLMLDIQGQSRPADMSKRDIGCDEYSNGSVLNQPLTRKNAGPSYLKDAAVVKSDSIKKEDTHIKDTTSFENAYFRVKQNQVEQLICDQDTRVVVALSNIRIKRDSGTIKLSRGEIRVIEPLEPLKVRAGEYIVVTLKKNHPPLKAPEKWIEPAKNKILYNDKNFRVFEEDLAAGDVRDLHSHAQRIAVRLNDVQLTDPRFSENQLPGAGLQVANTFKYAEPVVHVVKNLSKIPLFNIIIEYKLGN